MNIVKNGYFKSTGRIGMGNTNQIRYKEKSFCMSSQNIFLKYGLLNNHLLGPSVMNPRDALSFQQINAIRERIILKNLLQKPVNTTEDIDNGNDEYSENLIYKFLLKTILIKTLMVSDKNKVTKQPWKHIYDVNENNNLNNKIWCFQQSLYQNVQNI